MKLTILGNNSALPAYGRYPTCQIVEIEGVLILVDCGESVQILLQKHGFSHAKISHIFISHLHGDHYFGLPGLINSMGLMGRKQPLNLYAPQEIMPIIQNILDVANTILPYNIIFKALENNAQTLFKSAIFSLESFPVIHGIFCNGLVITQFSKGRKILSKACSQFEIPRAYYKKLKEGFDYIKKDGELVKNEWVTEAGKDDKKYAYCADTRYTESFLPYIKGAQIIYHESTYLSDNEERAFARFHSTAKQAAQIAHIAQCQKLILGHYSAKYKFTNEFEEEARTIFSESYASKEGDQFEL